MGRSARVAIMDGQRTKTFGSALIRARQAAGLTQSQLGAAVSIPQSTLSVWERGDAEPSPEVVFELERALGVKAGSLSRLLGFAPVNVQLASSVEAAILADPKLDPYQRKLLIQIYESWTGD